MRCTVNQGVYIFFLSPTTSVEESGVGFQTKESLVMFLFMLVL